MPVTNDSITASQLDFLAHAVLSESLLNPGKAIALGRSTFYTYNTLLKAAKKQSAMDKGGVRVNVKGLRDQQYTWWDGTDVLPFEEHYTGEAMKFYAGRGHFGDMLPHDFAQRAGIKIDYETGSATTNSVSSSVSTRVVNLLTEKADDINYARMFDMAKTIMKSNADKAKAPTGLLGLHPLANPTYGDIGGMSRSNPRFQHYVDPTAWTVDNVQLRSAAFFRTLSSRSGGRKCDLISCGDDMYDLISSLYLGTSTVTGKLNFQQVQDKAMKMGEKLQLTLPTDAFAFGDLIIARDQIYNELHADDPSFGWKKILLAMNTDVTYLAPLLVDKHIMHAPQYNQRVSYESWHDELAVVSCMPNSFGIATTAYAGTSQPW